MIRVFDDDERKAREARLLMDTPAIKGIAELARDQINKGGRQAFNLLRYHLARSYVEGYAAGWKTARRERGEVMPPPET